MAVLPPQPPQPPQPGQPGQQGGLGQIDPKILQAVAAIRAQIQQGQQGSFLSPRSGGFLGPARETRDNPTGRGGSGPRVFQQPGAAFPQNNSAKIMAQVVALLTNLQAGRGGGGGGTQGIPGAAQPGDVQRRDTPLNPAEQAPPRGGLF